MVLSPCLSQWAIVVPSTLRYIISGGGEIIRVGGTIRSPEASNSVKDEPRTPNISPKPSFRPVKSSPNVIQSSVQWRTSSSSPPPNKTCNTVSSTTSQHPCDRKDGGAPILNLLTGPLVVSSAEATRLISTSETAITNVTWPATRSTAPPTVPKKHTYNCYWLTHVGPCNRQFPNKEDLYNHLKSHVNDLEALTPATAVLQPLNPPACGGTGCHDGRKHHRFNGGPYQMPGLRCMRASSSKMPFGDRGAPDYKRRREEFNRSPPRNRGMDEGSRVIQLSHVNELTEGDIRSAMEPFGQIRGVASPSPDIYFVEFGNLDQSHSFMGHVDTHGFLIRFTKVDFTFGPASDIPSCMGALSGRGVGGSQGANHVLAVNVLKPLYPITTEVLHTIASPHGKILRIVIHNRNETKIESLVEFEDVQGAERCKRAISGADIYAGCCTLDVEFSTAQSLNVFKNDDDTYDYTDINPTIAAGN
eukprot:sb/3464353/